MHLWKVSAAPILVILIGLFCELYTQYQVAILYFCTEIYFGLF